MKGARILVVEDDPAAARYLTLALAEEGCDVRQAADGVEALRAMEAQLPELVISDLRMPEMDGLGLLTRVKQRWPEMPFILQTVEEDVATVVEAVKRGALNYLIKPVALPTLLGVVGKALSVPAVGPVRDEKLPEIVGVSKAIVEVRHLVAVAARSDVNVLITGETGTGKELVARAIHRCSKLSKGPLIAHNCAATPADLFESQFFGHRRGAFTGADRDHVGLLERADGGVLFLDELESLSPVHQAKLLRVIDDGEVRPLGSGSMRRVSVRFVAATNRDPRGMIDIGEFREDLYYRLRGFEIHLPPLKDRPKDIPLLATQFLNGKNRRFSPQALDVLAAEPWPGNVRELRNVVRSAESLAAGNVIGLEHLSLERAYSKRGDGVRKVHAWRLKDAEREAIVASLRACCGNKSRAARMLGIDRSTLRRKLREFDIEPIASPGREKGG